MENDLTPVKLRAKKYLGIYLTVILFVISFGGGLIIGRFWMVKKQITNSGGTVDVTKLVNLNRNLNRSDSVDFKQFWDVWDRVKKSYVKQPVKEVDLFYGAIQGMVAALDDPYSLYFSPKEADEFAKDLSGELEGIGAEIGSKNKQIVVVAPLPNTPAEKAGILAGDKILAIDKKTTFGMDVFEAVSKIRGKAGTNVVLTILRNGSSKSIDITITRQKINVPSVSFSIKDNNIAYVRIIQFGPDTVTGFNNQIKEIINKKSKGIILDLRNNPGGYLDSSVDIASAWIKDGLIVSEKGKSNVTKDHNTKGSHALIGYKTVVLINQGSASASEIVAGALHDHKAAVLVGEKSFGKGSVQDYQALADGSALKITVAEWFTPNGVNINQSGIEPDIEVKTDWEKDKADEDKVLDVALSLFSSSTFSWK